MATYTFSSIKDFVEFLETRAKRLEEESTSDKRRKTADPFLRGSSRAYQDVASIIKDSNLYQEPSNGQA